MSSLRRTEVVSRSQRSKEISEQILATALSLLATDGVDGMTMQRIAARAELSNGPLYGRYDTPEDILIDLWETELRPQLGWILAELSSWSAGTDPEPPARLLAELSEPSEQSQALIETLAVVRRYPFAGETIRSDVKHDLEGFVEAQPELPASVSLGQLTMVLGSFFLGPIFLEIEKDLATVVLGFIRALGQQRDAFGTQVGEVVPMEVPLPRPDTGDEAVDAFVAAVIQVVAQTGFERATTHRIARVAKRSYSSSYSHFASKDDLMAYALTAMIDKIFSVSFFVIHELPPEERLGATVATIQAYVSDQNRLWRQLRVESVVAARHHPDLGGALRANFEVNRDRAVDTMGGVSMLGPDAIEGVIDSWHLIRTLGFGLSVLFCATGSDDHLDWTPGVAALVAVLRASIPGAPFG
jgi:AcrR family transcriptional regulator